ncbi:arylesterase [Aurantivibrio infirmus]
MQSDNQIKVFSLLLSFTILLLGGCGGNDLPKLDQGALVLAFGDSLTYGYGAELSESYPAVLAGLCSCEVINAGISGETTEEGLERFVDVLDQHQPSLLILMEGGNDILRNNTASTKANLSKMIEISQLNNISVVLIGVPEKNLFSKSAPLYRELAEEYELVFEDELLSTLLKNPRYKSDSVHLNREGYARFAENIFDLLKTNGAF